MPPSCCKATTVQTEMKFANADEARKSALQMAKEGKVHQSFIAFTAALELDETDPTLYDEFAQFLFANNQLEGAEYMFERALTLDPLNVDYIYRRGVVMQQQKQYPQAIQCFVKALTQNPKFIGALFNLGVVHRDTGDYHAAIENFRRILKIDEHNKDAMVLMSECLAEIGDLD